MDQIETIPGKLFYLIYQMHKDNEIDSKGRIILKDMVILGSPSIADAYEQYVKDGTELTLRSTLFRLQKAQKEAQKDDGKSQKSRKSRKGPMISIPPKNIQKVPNFLRSS